MTTEIVSAYEPPFILFPENPTVINIGGYDVYEYITPEQMDKYFREAADRLGDLSQYDYIVYNENGGRYVAEHLFEVKRHEGPAIPIKYHHPYGGEVKIVRGVPDDIRAGMKVLVVEDILDSGQTIEFIEKDCNGADITVFCPVHKTGVEGQILPRNFIGAVKIPDHWVGGCGMDIGVNETGIDEEAFRNYFGVVVKIGSFSR